jgi:hypothetical protein
MINLPETESDLQHLVNNNIPEDVHLDYKASDALSDKKKDDILKDVSAFANSDGGILIYGIAENKTTQTISIDNGIEPTKNWKEWLEQIIDSGISPKIDNLEINAIKLNNGRFAYTIKISKSPNAPHQSSDKKYYKRSNSKSSPMEHYEIEDIRNRSNIVMPLVNVDIEIRQGIAVNIVISNQGDHIAENISFIIPEPMKKQLIKTNRNIPPIFSNGLKLLPPKKTLKFGYSSYSELVDNDDLKVLTVEVHYFHQKLNGIKIDRFSFNFEDFYSTLVEESEIELFKNSLNKNLDKIASHLEKLTQNIEIMSKNIRQTSKLKAFTDGYFIENKSNTTLYEYDCRVTDVVNSSHNAFEQNLSRFIYFVNNDKNINKILSTLPQADFNLWYDTALLSTKTNIGRTIKLNFPENELEKIALLNVFFEKISKGNISYYSY